jgi:4-alpha-glucanotransferase
LRESKRNSEWDEPNLEYESRTKDFIQHLLDPQREFFWVFNTFLQKVSAAGKMTSLSSLVLKHTLPGVPDTYQGTELWDLSMVDPDNRRPVDYQLRAKIFTGLAKSATGSIANRLSIGEDGQIKMHLLHCLLQLRKQNPDLFSKGRYMPLTVKGKHAARVIAYSRQYKDQWLIITAAVNFAGLLSLPSANLADLDWGDTHLILPDALTAAYTQYRDELSGADLKAEDDGQDGESVIALSGLLNGLPVSVRSISIPRKKRGAGVLMHISSLPSAYGIGDFGPAAARFLDFLNASGMKYWQVLPMNPLSAEQAYSPYSSASVLAGNTLLISPEDLTKAGLLNGSDLENYRLKIKPRVSYPRAAELKSELLALAYQNWNRYDSGIPKPEFEQFCRLESWWLEDYALFVMISRKEQNKPWFEWPSALKNRKPAALKVILNQYADELKEICWQQFIFFRQWKALKSHANRLGIEIIGDLPFYAAHNSADVWTHRKIFALGADGKVKGMAGVPPDYFNDQGQLWGMPVYNWKAMGRNHYQWWIDRIRKNLEIYDQIRLDHFRAISEYWEVPAGSETAKEGNWKPGPGAPFFHTLLKAIGTLPVIAEDLGEINQEVYQLRDKFGFPGMKVLQFAFGSDMPASVHAPHNFESANCIVYTGTHDNNTTKGWFQQETDENTRRRLEVYIGEKVTKKKVATQMIRMALGSTAAIAIIPMQDLLGKSGKSRMNRPASSSDNWMWRLKSDELSGPIIKAVKSMLLIYGR